MTQSSMSPIRNLQCQQSTPLLDPPFLTHFWLRYQYEIFRVSSLGGKTSFMTSWMTLSSMSPIRNPQRPLSTPLLDPPILDTLIIEISTPNFQGIFLGIKKHHSWPQEWQRPPWVWSGALNVLQVPSFWPPPWHTYLCDFNSKFSGYLPWGKKTPFMTWGITLSSMSLVRISQRPPNTPFLDPPFLTHFWLRYRHEMFRVSSLG